MSDDSKVSVTLVVASHQVTVEAPTDLETVAAKALELFNATAPNARSAPVGFGAAAGQFESQPAYIHSHRAEVES